MNVRNSSFFFFFFPTFLVTNNASQRQKNFLNFRDLLNTTPWPSLSLLILVGPSSMRQVCKSNITFQPKSPKTKHTKQHISDLFYPSKTHTTKFLNSFLSPFLLFLVSLICALSLSNGGGLGLLQFCSEGYDQE